jgi:uncharacterized membrane protein YbhN (UPF0104 family)
MDLSTFGKVLWLISFCNFFDVIAIFLLFWLIFLNEKARNFIYDKLGYGHVVGCIGNLDKTFSSIAPKEFGKMGGKVKLGGN